MRRSDDTNIEVRRHHLRMAKSIASLKGMSLKEYFGVKVEEDALNLPKEFLKHIPFDPPPPRRTRRGNIALDIIVMFVCLGVLAIFFLLAYPPLKTAMTSIGQTTNLTGGGQAILENTRDAFPSIYDNAYVFFFMGVWLFFLISAYFIENHPIFFVINLIIMLAALMVIPIIGNAIEATVLTSSARSSFPYIVFMSGHFLELCLLVFFTVVIAFFARNKERGSAL